MNIEVNGKKFATYFSTQGTPDGLTFLTADSDFIQVGLWHYGKGKSLAAHNHNFVERSINRTQEFIFVCKGSLKSSIYDEEDRLIHIQTLKAGEGLIVFEGGHGYDILEEGTLVIETKNGPYVGAEKDRRRLSQTSLRTEPSRDGLTL